jgi:hypothetical protein
MGERKSPWLNSEISKIRQSYEDRIVESHISRKTSEMWGTHRSFAGQRPRGN